MFCCGCVLTLYHMFNPQIYSFSYGNTVSVGHVVTSCVTVLVACEEINLCECWVTFLDTLFAPWSLSCRCFFYRHLTCGSQSWVLCGSFSVGETLSLNMRLPYNPLLAVESRRPLWIQDLLDNPNREKLQVMVMKTTTPTTPSQKLHVPLYPNYHLIPMAPEAAWFAVDSFLAIWLKTHLFISINSELRN